MSTAVLAGAQLEDWIADSEADYLSKAKEAAQKLSFLRQNRGIWRQQLEQSPLGDPMGLMRAIEDPSARWRGNTLLQIPIVNFKLSAESSGITYGASLHFISQLNPILLAAWPASK